MQYLLKGNHGQNAKCMIVGIVGNGFVGKATMLMSSGTSKDHGGKIDHVVVDRRADLCMPPGSSYSDLKKCDIIFICVPTPMSVDGSCYTGIVEEAVAEARGSAPDVPIVVRSTVPPGTCEAIKVAFMPEFLTEKNWTRDVYETEEWIIGSCRDTVAAEIIVADILRAGQDSGVLSGCALVGVGTTAAELIKYGKNAFLATKVSMFNELSSLCEAAGVPFDAVRNHVTKDKRIGPSHTNVPGHDGHKGFGGTCLPKDIHALALYARGLGVRTPVINSVIFRNDEIDRPEKDWRADKGRAVVDA